MANVICIGKRVQREWFLGDFDTGFSREPFDGRAVVFGVERDELNMFVRLAGSADVRVCRSWYQGCLSQRISHPHEK